LPDRIPEDSPFLLRHNLAKFAHGQVADDREFLEQKYSDVVDNIFKVQTSEDLFSGLVETVGSQHNYELDDHIYQHEQFGFLYAEVVDEI
jgi:hypothetical protein